MDFVFKLIFVRIIFLALLKKSYKSMQKRIFYYLIIFLLVVQTGLLIYSYTTRTKIAYVDGKKMFSEFRMTSELKALGQKELKVKMGIVDSLTTMMKMSQNSEVRDDIMNKLIDAQQALSDFETNYASENSKKIWDRINLYSIEFAEKEGYDLIFNSYNDYSLLGGKKENDITAVLLDFINKKYEGFE